MGNPPVGLGMENRHSCIPERVLLGSLWESDSHILILMPIIGWSISEQDGAYEPVKVALGFASRQEERDRESGGEGEEPHAVFMAV